MFLNFAAYFLIYLIFIFLVAGSLVLLKKKLRLDRLIVAVLLFIFVPLFAGYAYMAYFAGIPEVSVPDLAGYDFEAALMKLRLADLRGKHAGSVFDAKIPEGEVVSQSPEPGRRVKAGRTVNLILSSGQKKVSVPNLLGRQLGQVEAVLSAGGLRLGQVGVEIAPEFSAGVVLSQNPLPGEEVEADSPVNIIIAQSAEAEVSRPGAEQGGFRLW